MLRVPEKEHSLVGGSSCERWLNCPASVQLIAQSNIEDKSSTYANEGNAAHHLLAICLDKNEEPWQYIDEEIQVNNDIFKVTSEMSNHVQTCLTFVNKLINEHAALDGQMPIVHSEVVLQSYLDPEVISELDILIETFTKLIVIDFKYGQGIVVEPDSWQNKYYGYLAYENAKNAYPMEAPVDLYIVQPRIPHPNGRIRVFETTVEEMVNTFQDKIIPGIVETRNPNAIFKVGSWCRFCAAKHNCNAIKNEALDFDIDIEPEGMSSEELGESIMRTDVILQYYKSLLAEGLKRAKQGEAIAYHKLVYKQANRRFRDMMKDGGDEEIKLVDALVNNFGDEDIYAPKTLKSPAGIEKLPYGKPFVKRWAYKPTSELTLVHQSHKSPAVKITPGELFGEQDGKDLS